ncbi:MAG: cytochrome b/b6 domain-containing protein [Rhizobiaceae bacterium]
MQIKISAGYSTAQKALHWVVALIIVQQVVLHENMLAAWEAYTKNGDAAGLSSLSVQAHVWGGLAVLGFALWRVWLRRTHGAPAVPANEPPLLKLAAHATHVLLYALMIFVPISGAAAYFGGVALASTAHVVMKNVLIPLVLLHVAGALYHHFWLKSDVLKRMTHG